MQDAVSLIQTVGFPIATAIACGYFIYKQVNREQDEALARENKADECLGKLTDALTKNAESIEKGTETNASLAETNKLLAVEVKASLDRILAEITTK